LFPGPATVSRAPSRPPPAPSPAGVPPWRARRPRDTPCCGDANRAVFPLKGNAGSLPLAPGFARAQPRRTAVLGDTSRPANAPEFELEPPSEDQGTATPSGLQEPPPSRTRRQDAAVAAGYHRAPCRRTGAALRLHHRQPLARGQWTLHRPLAELQHVLIRKRPPLFLVVGERVAAVGPGHHDPVHHLQCPLPVPVLLPALHPHQGRPLLHHGSLPDPGWSVRDERGGHLHGAAHGVASQLGLLLRLRLHPGLGGLPAGPPQRRSLRDLAETRMRHPDPVRARVCACVRGSELTQAREERNQKLRKKLKALAPTAPSESKPNRKQLLSIEDVYNIYGL
uniref:Uncharacterized protein n=1 Tax=Oryctolagus cuniculus TaxID=9986 RepID=G1TRS9_RABIT